MPATVTSLDREIAVEERLVGLRPNQPLTDGAITRRRLQITTVLGGCGFVALLGIFASTGVVRVGAIALAAVFAAYAVEKDHHLRRLTLLRGDSRRITLVVAGELMHSGALMGDRELLDLRADVGRAAGRLAAGLVEVLAADCTRVRLVGPSGEVPIAAEREVAARRPVPDEPAAARTALDGAKSARAVTADDRAVLVVPLWRANDLVGLLEAVSRPGERYRPGDVNRAEAYARGAVAALLAPR